jgi:small nuclear ribonucleoprotein (snRNP)-like protein
MVELKSGDTYNGVLESIDKLMNIKLKDVIFSSKVKKTNSCFNAKKINVLFNTKKKGWRNILKDT